MNKKRIVPVLLALLLCCALLAGCQSSAVKNVNELMSQMDPSAVDPDLVEKVRDAYELLPAEDREKIENAGLLTEMENRVAALDMDSLFSSLGTITLDSADAIAAARDAYDRLSPEIKQYVTGLDALEAAERTLHQLQIEDAARVLDEMIAGIGEVTLDSGETIEAARDAVNAAPMEVRNLLKRLSNLSAAEQALAALRDQAAAEEISSAIAALGKVTLDSADAVAALRAQFDALPETARDLVGNADVLTAAENTIQGLKDKAAAAEIKTMSAKDPAGAIEYAENYIGSRDLNEVQGDVVKNCVHAYVLLSQQYIKEYKYQDAERLLEGCCDRYSAHAAVSEAKKALDALHKKMAEPANGKIFTATAKGGYSEVKIENKGDAVFVKIVNTSNPSKFVTVYIRANSTATFHMVDGTYSIHLAEGDTWYNDVELFGSSTRYSSVNTTFSLETSRSGSYIYYSIYTLTLHTTGGTIGSSNISGDEF